MPVHAVIFDIGNVLIEWQPERFYDLEIGVARRRALFAQVDLHAMNELIDCGAPFQKTVHATADAYPEWRREIRMWHEDWIRMASPVIPHSVRLLRQLRVKGVPVYALSNFGTETFEVATGFYEFLTEFDLSFVSGHMAMTKPDPAIYAAVEESCGHAPEMLLFADDRADNIAAADVRGWQTHLFDGPVPWAARLVAEGLLTPQEAA
ncbi:MAG: 2-haloacid dehalogenase [Paracoccaceae bacterium]|jgi:2-haloacid dehalogenase|tara:strand:+ start:66 stop:686 length:621 start_codon:yes stop_codon:yes gene_type:complete